MTTQQDGDQKDPLKEALEKAQQEEQAKQAGEEQKVQDGDAKDAEASELEKCKAELAKMTEVAQRTMADLANFKRRTEEERGAMASFANAGLMGDIIPAIDNFKRALDHLPEGLEGEAKNWADGIMGTFKQLQDSLAKHGLKEMETLNQDFDPNLHQAVLQGPGEKDKVVEEMESGYMLGEKVIRHAKVKVGSGD